MRGGMQVIQPSEDLAKQHYAEHDGKPFFAGLVDFLTSGPVVSNVPLFEFQSSEQYVQPWKS
jgi:nucleoside diphosphate kinase